MFEKKEAAVYLAESLLDYIEKWKDVRGSLIMILHRVQEEYGYIPREVALQLSRMLNVPLAKIYGITTFYHYFRLSKPGKYNIEVCMGTACYLKGGEDILHELEAHLGIGAGGVTEDGIFSLQSVRCVGCCGLGPVVTINGEVFGRFSRKDVMEIISNFRKR